MRRRHASTAGALLLTLSLLDTGIAQAKPTPEQILLKSGITRHKTCQDLGAPGALKARRLAWSKAINALGKQDPEYLLRWVVGATAPPKMVLRETRMQRDCMLSAIMHDAAKPDVKLMLDYGDGGHTKKAMARWARQIDRSSTWRAKAIAWFVRSHHRNASAQAGIWWRKYSFSSQRSFNAISEKAGARCGLTPGQTWKPAKKSHRTCWKKRLSPDERQQEILRASSAPGLSRHHWGTDIDIFGLNPRRFLPGQKLHDEYRWMEKNALSHGFFQTYIGPKRLGRESYMEERWHWSYYPIGQALHQWSLKNKKDVKGALFGQWDRLERRWGRHKTSPFSYVRARWEAYFFGVAPVHVTSLYDPDFWSLPQATIVAAL